MSKGRKLLRTFLVIAAVVGVAWTGTRYLQARLSYAAWMEESSTELHQASRIIARHERRLDSKFYARVPASVYRADLEAADRARPVVERLSRHRNELREDRQGALRRLQLALGVLVVVLFVARALTPYEPRWQ